MAMTTLGVEVRAGGLVGVRIDDRGEVLARATRPLADAAMAADLVRALVVDGPVRLGAAVRDPADPICSDIVAAAVGAVRAEDAPRMVTKGAAVVLAEQWRGAARDAAHVVALTSDDCVHAGLMIGGRLIEGAHGLAGSAGWLALNPVERDDYRRFGCLEAEIGAPGIVRRLVWRVKAGDASRVVDMAGGLAVITVNHVFEAARQGDGVAIAVVRDTVRYIGMAIGNLVATLDPEVVVLGGVIAAAGDLLVEPSRAEAVRRMSPAAAGSVRIVGGTLGEDAPSIGAARAAMLSR